MTEFLVKHFVKNYNKVEDVSVRTSYGMLTGIVGILCNILLFLIKGMTGIFLNSVSVIADAFNNLSDAGSSVISIIGVKIAGMPADKKHPFGHGRIEYLTALIVSFLVMQVGFTFLKDSFGKIRHPEAIKFQSISIVILLISIIIKMWLGRFNKKIGERIDSKVMLAVSADAVGDVITTSVTILSILIYYFTGKNIDGFVGAGVSLVVMWAGLGIARETIEPLIGQAADPEEYHKITDFVCGYEGILGTHDLVIHNYGPGRSMASVHAEVPNTANIEDAHEIIDRIERDAADKLGIVLVIHMDPVETKNQKVLEMKERVDEIVRAIDPALEFHDFRMVYGKKQINLIFDLVVPYEYNEETEKATCQSIKDKLQEKDERVQCIITVERGYVRQD